MTKDVWGFKSKTGNVLGHWIAFIDSFNSSPLEFYGLVEKALESRKVPGLKITKVEHSEGGLLSGNRVYLRMMRERLTFEACAAPFGTGFFFSCRTVYIPAEVKFWHAAVIIFAIYLAFAALNYFLEWKLAVIALATLLLAITQVFRSTLLHGLADLDAALINMPAVGPVYERWFRKETYFREDTRLVYLEVVPKVIREAAEELVAANGLRLTRKFERAPVLGALYTPVRDKGTEAPDAIPS